MINVPSNFRVIAIISTFNEEDIIVPVINYLFKEGVSVYLIDNWSTDRTFELVNQIRPSTFLIGIERWPKDGPSSTFDWEEILKRKEVLSQKLYADWFMHYDADEIRESPWVSIKLRDAIYIVDQHGYNAIDFELLNFLPVNNKYQPGSSLVKYFKYFLFNDITGNELQIKAWKRQRGPINLSKFGGHSVEFEDRKVFPYKFIMRHYPIRSQEHGERKVFSERNPRFKSSERKRDWHIQYNHFHEGSNFLNDPADLIKFRSSFYDELMIKQTLEREQALEKLANQVIEGENEIEELKMENHIILCEANSQIVRLSQDLDERNAQNVRLIQEINDRNAQNVRLIQEINDRNAQNVRLIQEIAALNNDLVTMSKIIDEKDNKIKNFINSRSWRITRPLRRIDALVRKLRHFETVE
jgi:hypothetical protein